MGSLKIVPPASSLQSPASPAVVPQASSLTPQASRVPRAAVIGGGITGLAAAHRLLELEPTWQVTLFEAAPALGGVLRTEARDGWLLEHSADNFITNVPWGLDLCRRIGFEAELIRTRSEDRRALIVRNGRLYPAPEGLSLMAPARLWPLVTTPLLSWRGKLRLLAEYFVPRRRETSDESLADFSRRRLGREAFERLVQPLVSGIYTADAERLSVAAALPRFVEMERRHRSLIRAARKKRAAAGEQSAGARYGLFVAPRQGMGSLVAALAGRLAAASIRTGAVVTRLQPRPDGGWQVGWRSSTDGQALGSGARASGAGGQESLEDFAGVIVALPASAAAGLVRPFAADLASELGQIEYAGTAVALVGYKVEQVTRPLAGFGFVVPWIEKRRILAVSCSSNKFPGRAPEGHLLFRVFLGGSQRPDLVVLDDDQLREVVAEELGDFLGIRGEPVLFQVQRWAGHMPQYHLGHLDRVARIERGARDWPGLELAGSAYRGVGIPDCVASGEGAAERLGRA